MEVLEQVRWSIERNELLQPDQSLVVGVSGGADSLCLLHCLIRLGYRCVVAHLDHGLRPSSRQEADRVAKVAANMGLPFNPGRVELDDGVGSLEEAARAARYQFLASVAHSQGLDTVAVGHTADDQAETVLMHLLRGAGPEGLRGMLPESPLGEWVGVWQGPPVRLIRPLLEVRRRETQDYCAEVGLEPIVDESNLDPRHFRNRLRHELLPELERYNPRIRTVLTRTAKVMAGEAALTEQLLARRWSDWARSAGEGALALRREALEQAPVALQRAALRRAIQQLRPTLRDVDFDTVERIVRGLDRRNGRQRTVVGGLEVIPLEAELVIRLPGAHISFPELPQLPDAAPRPLRVPGSLELAAGWRLQAEPASDPGRRPRSRDEVLLSSKWVGGDLEVRPPRPGERLAPLGMRGHMKLSDLFVNRKVPWPARERWPLVCHGEQVLWAVGLHVSRRAIPEEGEAQPIRLRAIAPRPGAAV